MKTSKVLCYIPLSLLFITNIVKAQENDGQVEVIHQEMKCHVNLVGGQETIHYTGLFRGETVLEAKNKLQERKILTILSPKKLAIYKVNECVLKEKRFSSLQAINLEKRIEL